MKSNASKRGRRLASPSGSARCEGWRWTGIFQIGGTGRWEQCKNAGIVTLKFKDAGSGKVKTLPACKECWAKCLATGVTIIEEHLNELNSNLPREPMTMKNKQRSKSPPSGSPHLLRVDYKDGDGFWVHRGGVPVVGTKDEMDALAKTMSFGGGTMRVVRAGAPSGKGQEA